MNYGIITKITNPVRSGPDHRSEMINQLLFGESFRIKEEIGEWIRVEGTLDSYSGWLVRKDIMPVKKENINTSSKNKAFVTRRLTRIYKADDKNESFLIFAVLMKMLLYYNKEKFYFKGGFKNS